jgi:hypothetical protein
VSILINNYRALYIVNNKFLLIPSLLVYSKANKVVKVGLSLILIKGKGTYLLKGVLDFKGVIGVLDIRDLELINIALVEGFYINIILELIL